MASPKQVNYALILARKAGMSTKWMDSSWKGIATMRERSGRVDQFLTGLNVADASKVIDALKSRAGE